MKIYNTMTRSKEEFVTLSPGRVKMYACGPTVYNYFHLGNARPFITYDTLRRYLEYRGFEVEFCQNFTDIDDRMISIANEQGVSVREHADRFIAEYYIDADKLRVLRPTYQPRATDTIDEMVSMIDTLVKKGFAYEMDDGVYFDVSQFDSYGALSRYNLDELKENADERVLQGDDKKNASDFVLWKKQKPEEPAWPSPWGAGRPGWHIECSAMIKKYLGETIDIHGGGQDLIFPHHENEIAQSEAANGVPFVRYWMHNAFVNVDNEKMSKSAGNFFMIRDIVKEYDYDVIRFFILTGHYRMPINFSADLLRAAENGLDRIANSVANLKFVSSDPNRVVSENTDAVKAVEDAITKAKQDFLDAMDDDMNTADAITAIFQLVRAANYAASSNMVPSKVLVAACDRILELSTVLGIAADRDLEKANQIPSRVAELVQARTDAKQKKDFALADQIREQIAGLGYQVKDTPQGPQVTKL